MKKSLDIQIAESPLHARSVTRCSSEMKAPCSRLRAIFLLCKINVRLLVCLLACFSAWIPTDSEKASLN